MGKPVIAVRVPSLGAVHPAVVTFTNALSAMTGTPYTFDCKIVYGYKPHDYARNECIKEVFTDESIRKVWFIDSDIVASPKCIRLLHVDADIAVGLYGLLKRDPEGLLRPQTAVYAFHDDVLLDPVEIPEDGHCEVDAAGMGMMMIDRRVLTDPRMWLPNKAGDYRGKAKRLDHILFRHSYNPDGSLAVGEDADFCRRAKRCGYKIVADSSVRVGHIKEMDMLEFERSMAAERRQCSPHGKEKSTGAPDA